MKNRTCVRFASGLFPWLLFLTYAVQGQVVIRGVVVDAQQTPLASANVSLLNTYAGASSEADGTFSFSTDQRGSVTVQARCLGFADQQLTVRISDSTRVVSGLRLVLTERSVMLEGVTIRSRKTNFLATEGLPGLRPLEIRAMGGANADIGNGIRALPGVQATTDATGLFVRGGTADETSVYVDGLAVKNFFYVGSPDVSQRGRYAPELFSGNSFSSGGYSALYGQAMSGALVLASTGIATRSSVGGNVSTTGAALDYTRVVKADRFSINASLTYSNLGPYYRVIPQRRTYTGSPEFADLILNLKYKLANGGMLKLLGSLGTNTLQFIDQPFDQPTQYGLRSRNAFSSLSYTGSVGRKWTVNAGLAITLAGNRYQRDSLLRAGGNTGWASVSQTVEQQTYNSRVVFRRALSNAADLYVGAEHTANTYASTYARQDGRSYTLRANDQYGAVFAESNISLGRVFQTRIGLRAEASGLLHDAGLSPRLSLTYLPNKRIKVTGSYGQFYQSPAPDYLLRHPDRLNFQRATHYILTYQYTDLNKLLRVELYHKQYNHLIRTVPDTSSGGTGYASGLEVFWKEDSRIKNVNYWVSYSYLDTKRQYLGFPVEARPVFAAQHTVTMVVNVLLPALPVNIGLTYTGASGRPYYNPNRTEADFLTDRTPAYHNVGLTVAYLSRFFKSNSTLAFSVSNLLGSQQVFGYKYNGLTERVASTPLATRFFYVGLFLNWGTAQPTKTGNLPIPNAN
jgi:vitamin B12 transporter